MKSQHGLLAAGTAGLAAGILRIVQYRLTIDRDGYYLEGALSDILSGVLIGLLAAGTAFCLICGLLQKKEQCSFSAVFGRYSRRNGKLCRDAAPYRGSMRAAGKRLYQ